VIILRVVALTATSITLDGELPWTATSGTIAAHRIYRAWTAPSLTYIGCRVEWAYTSSSVVYIEEETLDVVRNPFRVDVASRDIVQAESLYTDSGPRNPSSQIAQATEDVFRRLRGSQIEPAYVVDRVLLQAAVVWRTLYLRHIRNEALRTVFASEYDIAYAQFLSSKGWMQTDGEDDGAVDAERFKPIKYMRIG
jgi:hypothetical protein